MEMITNNTSTILGIVMVMAFAVNIIVQITKEFIPVPTKLWCILVSASVVIGAMFAAVTLGFLSFSFTAIILGIIGSFIIAFIAMYGFDTFKELWERFKKGDNINE